MSPAWNKTQMPWTVPGRNDQFAPLWYWMSERHAIWQRRASGSPKPWTSDPILQRYRFCNVYRELDTVTIWIRENIREPFESHPHLWFMLAMARYINHPPTLSELIETPKAWPSSTRFDLREVTAVLDARKARGEQVYTGAYMIRAESNPKAPWYSWTKQRYIAEVVLGRLWEDRKELSKQLESTKQLRFAWELLVRNPRYVGWGPFMTYEWVTDLRWTRYLNDAADIMHWANAGPGALRGLRRLQTKDGRLSSASVRNSLVEMVDILEVAPKRLPPSLKHLELRDIEHSLCEMDKYLRVFHGEGKPRANYDGA